MTDHIQPHVPESLERLAKNAAAVHREISKLFPSGALPDDPVARAAIANLIQDFFDEMAANRKRLEDLLEILRRQ